MYMTGLEFACRKLHHELLHAYAGSQLLQLPAASFRRWLSQPGCQTGPGPLFWPPLPGKVIFVAPAPTCRALQARLDGGYGAGRHSRGQRCSPGPLPVRCVPAQQPQALLWRHTHPPTVRCQVPALWAWQAVWQAGWLAGWPVGRALSWPSCLAVDCGSHLSCGQASLYPLAGSVWFGWQH